MGLYFATVAKSSEGNTGISKKKMLLEWISRGSCSFTALHTAQWTLTNELKSKLYHPKHLTTHLQVTKTMLDIGRRSLSVLTDKTPNEFKKSSENTQPQLELCSAAASDSTVMIQGTDVRRRELKRQKENKRCKELFWKCSQQTDRVAISEKHPSYSNSHAHKHEKTDALGSTDIVGYKYTFTHITQSHSAFSHSTAAKHHIKDLLLSCIFVGN